MLNTCMDQRVNVIWMSNGMNIRTKRELTKDVTLPHYIQQTNEIELISGMRICSQPVKFHKNPPGDMPLSFQQLVLFP